MHHTDSNLTHEQSKQYQNALRKIMLQTEMTNRVFVTMRMKQAPRNSIPKLTIERAYKNNRHFFNCVHTTIFGNNWKRRFPNGLQRFSIIETAASIGIHAHMIIDSPYDINTFKEIVHESYQKTLYAGQPYKYIKDGEIVNVQSVFSDDAIDYITKLKTKPNFDKAFDIYNSYWASK